MILAEAKRRNYTHNQTLNVLCLALEQEWPDTTLVAEFLDRVDAYKTRLRTHLPEAAALYDGKAGPLDALTPEEQHQLLADVKEIRAQLGPSLTQFGWPSLGKNADDEELTLRDAFGVMKTDVAAVKKKLGA